MILGLVVINVWEQHKFNIYDKVKSHNSYVNVRVNPGINQTSIGILYVGDKGIIKEGPSTYITGYFWYRVNFNKGIYGWVAQDFLNAQSFEVPTGPFGDTTNYIPPPRLKGKNPRYTSNNKNKELKRG